MFKITPNGENRLDIEITGKMSSDDMTIALNEFISHAKGVKNGKLLYRIHGFHFASLSVIAIKFSRLPSLFGLIRKFDRMVLLAMKLQILCIFLWLGVLDDCPT